VRFFKISNILDGAKYLTKINGKYVFITLFGDLIIIEFTDILFALDSIPAIFAIIGLRSFYFFLENMIEKFKV
jgi:tellurite resistance protein TerC